MRGTGGPDMQDRYLQADVPQLCSDLSHQRHVLAVDEILSAPVLSGRERVSTPITCTEERREL